MYMVDTLAKQFKYSMIEQLRGSQRPKGTIHIQKRRCQLWDEIMGRTLAPRTIVAKDRILELKASVPTTSIT